MMKKELLGAMLSAFCLGLVVACKPQEPPKPDISVETAEVEAKNSESQGPRPTERTWKKSTGPLRI
jgi:hypothetical protein